MGRGHGLEPRVPERHIVLSHYKQPVAAGVLVRLCGGDPARWTAIVQALSAPTDSSETFGQFIDRFSYASQE